MKEFLIDGKLLRKEVLTDEKVIHNDFVSIILTDR